MTARRYVFGLLVCSCISTSCGGDDGDSPSDGPLASATSCNAQCDAQEKVRGTGCDPIVDLATCKQLCAQLVKNIGACGAQFNAYYDCSAADGFSCTGPLVTNKTNACEDELAALNSCRNGGMGGSGAACKGANPNGTCPQVPCPCREGTKMVSGFDTSSGSCKCLDTDTCQDLFCD
ncbi:MAG TPA: hypothetical protein VJR89_03345 [Polyangiales bacterium]|nr:hypothetical protein [Polyangiales bacterium]